MSDYKGFRVLDFDEWLNDIIYVQGSLEVNRKWVLRSIGRPDYAKESYDQYVRVHKSLIDRGAIVHEKYNTSDSE